jgi:type II secretory pathway component GspD/PulD (secretin)
MGMKISVTPFISPDGYLYLNMKPEYATEKDSVYAKNGETGSNDLVATLLRKNNLDLKNIRIKDGDTLILAGMMKETESKNVSKIPFLGDIPGIGMLFRSTSLDKEKSELVILVTPKIITDSDVPSDRIENSL